MEMQDVRSVLLENREEVVSSDFVAPSIDRLEAMRWRVGESLHEMAVVLIPRGRVRWRSDNARDFECVQVTTERMNVNLRPPDGIRIVRERDVNDFDHEGR
jgi:hypothetical protein